MIIWIAMNKTKISLLIRAAIDFHSSDISSNPPFVPFARGSSYVVTLTGSADWAYPESKAYGANMGPTWVLSAPGGSHVGPMNLAIWVCLQSRYFVQFSRMWIRHLINSIAVWLTSIVRIGIVARQALFCVCLCISEPVPEILLVAYTLLHLHVLLVRAS